MIDTLERLLESTLNDNDLNFELNHVNNKVKSASDIRDFLRKMNLPEKSFFLEKLKVENAYRANHTLFTFVLGLALVKFSKLDEVIKKEYGCYFTKKNDCFLKIWMITSLYHDYGYFIQDEYSTCQYLNEIKVENNIFDYRENRKNNNQTGSSSCLVHKPRYSREIFESYYHCFYETKHDANVQKVDDSIEHGITGGYVIFDEIMKRIKTMDSTEGCGISKDTIKNTYCYQDLCFRIMEHNIWTINPKNECCKKYLIKQLEPIFIGNYKKIDTTEPLLMILSLADTIEYIKRLSYKYLDKKNEYRPLTLAKKIRVDIQEDFIYIEFDKSIKRNSGFKKWKENILSLSDWLCVVTSSNDDSITIRK